MRFLKNTIVVLLSNATTIVSGVLVGFVLPLILSVNDYGYYKTFTLYITYLGLFSLGIIDGIVLKYGKNDYCEFDRCKFRAYYKWYLFVHLCIALVMCVITGFVGNENTRFIIIMLILNMFALNITGYFRQISEITKRFKEYSIVKVVQSSLNIFAILVLYVVYKNGNYINYKIYTVVVVCCNIVVSIWYMYSYRDIIFGKATTLQSVFVDMLALAKNGLPLMLANLCSTLILTLDRQFVNILFDNATYAVYAFAYNLLSILTLATSAVSTVLYPSLKRMSQETMNKKYPHLVVLSLLFIYAMMILYFPMSAFIRWLLPDYDGALYIFRIIFPGLPISSTITVVMHNYYKAMGDNFVYFKRSVIVLIISGIANLIAYLVFKTPAAISGASVVTMLIWYLYTERHLIINLKIYQGKNLLFILLCTMGFYVISCIEVWAIGMLVYMLFFFIIAFALYRNIIVEIKLLLH